MNRRWPGWQAGLFCVALLLAWPLQAAEEVRRFYGYAYDAATGAYAYTEVHAQRVVNGEWRGGTVDYYAPDGRKLGRKTLSIGEDRYVARYEMELADGSGSAIRDDGAAILVSRTENGRTESKRLALETPTCADVGTHLFMRDHFAQLLAGETLRFHLIAAPHLARFKFRAMKIGEARFEDEPVIVIRLEPDSMLRLVSDPVEMRYRPRDRELIELRSPANVNNPATGKPYDARVVYASRKPADAPRELPPLDG